MFTKIVTWICLSTIFIIGSAFVLMGHITNYQYWMLILFILIYLELQTISERVRR